MMLNLVSGRYAELAPWHGLAQGFKAWMQRVEWSRRKAAHTHEQYTPRLGMDADTQVMLTVARQQMTNLTK